MATEIKTPLLFIGHGSPMNAIEENEFVDSWRNVARTLIKPDVILCISAHWETNGTYITAMENPRTIHDFGGFPRELYEIQYPAPGKPELAQEIKELVSKTRIESDLKWGLDHGCWSILRQMFPAADIPVVQISIDHYRSAQYHYDLAGELSDLRQKGVLIIGSGNIVHNLGQIDWENMEKPGFGYDWANEANEKMKAFILSNDYGSLIDYQVQGKSFMQAIPTSEHYLPLLYILAMKSDNEKVYFFNDKLVGGSISMTSLMIN